VENDRIPAVFLNRARFSDIFILSVCNFFSVYAVLMLLLAFLSYTDHTDQAVVFVFVIRNIIIA